MVDAEKARSERAKAVLAAAAAADADLDAATGLDKRRKSRVKEFAERATKAGEIGSPVDANLQTMDQAETVADMARAGLDPDWEDNPDHLDTSAEVRADLREDGLDPVDVNTEERAAFGHFLLHTFANDPDRGGRTPEQLEAEHDMVVDAMIDEGMDHDSPLDLQNIQGGQSFFNFDEGAMIDDSALLSDDGGPLL